VKKRKKKKTLIIKDGVRSFRERLVAQTKGGCDLATGVNCTPGEAVELVPRKRRDGKAPRISRRLRNIKKCPRYAGKAHQRSAGERGKETLNRTV